MSKKGPFVCLNCNKAIPFKGYTYNHKYCDNKCQADYQSRQKLDKWRVLFDEGRDIGRPRQRKILAEKHGYECAVCGLHEWQEKPITLQVDHIDGNWENNVPLNLRLICPNCHSQTATFAGANRGKGRWSKGLKKYYSGYSFGHGTANLGLQKSS